MGGILAEPPGASLGVSASPMQSMPRVVRRRARALAVAAALAGTQGAAGEELALRLSRSLETPAPVASSSSATPASAATPRTPRTPGGGPVGPLTLDTRPKGALFLRADRLEGTNVEMTAQGHVELRTREQTVLADTLIYNSDNDEIFARGNVVLRQGFDWITGPELKFKRDTETGYFTAPRFNVTEANAKGSASEIRFKGPDQYEASNATYTTCVAPRPDWYLTSEELEIDNSRKVATAHNAKVYFQDLPIGYAPWLEFPLSNERKSGFLTPILGSSGGRGFEAATPYYFNLAPNYDATIVPRYMTKRGLQLGGQFRYLLGDAETPFGQAAGEINAEFLPHDQVTGTNRYGMNWKHNEQFTPHLAGFLDLQKVSDDAYFADLADRIAITSQRILPRDGGIVYNQGPWSFLARAQSYQTLQDPNLPVTPPYNRLPQLLASLSDTELLRAHVEWLRGVREVHPGRTRADRRPVRALSHGVVRAARLVVVLQRPGRRAHARIQPRKADRGHPRPASRRHRPDHEHRRRPHLRARARAVRSQVHADARAARVLRLHPLSPPGPDAGVRHGDRRLQFLAALRREPLSRQRPHRRRQPAHGRADVALPRPRHRRRAAAPGDRAALLLRPAAGDAQRVAALRQLVRLPRRRRRPHHRCLGDVEPPAIQLRRRPGRALQRGRPLHAGRRTRAERHLPLHARPRRRSPDRHRRADQAGGPVGPVAGRRSTGRCSAAGTTRSPTTRRSRRWRASSTMATAGSCASSASG